MLFCQSGKIFKNNFFIEYLRWLLLMFASKIWLQNKNWATKVYGNMNPNPRCSGNVKSQKERVNMLL